VRITRRGKIVLAVAASLAIGVIVWISGHIWWTDGGYCVGSMKECIGL
jgi:hypothetical protein